MINFVITEFADVLQLDGARLSVGTMLMTKLCMIFFKVSLDINDLNTFLPIKMSVKIPQNPVTHLVLEMEW